MHKDLVLEYEQAMKKAQNITDEEIVEGLKRAYAGNFVMATHVGSDYFYFINKDHELEPEAIVLNEKDALELVTEFPNKFPGLDFFLYFS